MFRFEVDYSRKMVLLVASGFMSLSEVDDMNAQMFACAAKAHREFGVFRMLTDAREAPVQSAETNARFKVPTEAMKGPNDRYAAVMNSTLLKIQSERVFTDERARAFLSMDAARTWLLTDMP